MMQVTVPCVCVRACTLTGASSNSWTCFSATTPGREEGLKSNYVSTGFMEVCGQEQVKPLLEESWQMIWGTVRAIMWVFTFVRHRGSTRSWGKDLEKGPCMGRSFNQSSQLVRDRSKSTM